MIPLPRQGLYAVTADRYPDGDRLLREVGEALQGGAVMLQFRDKSGDAAWRLACVRRLLELCHGHGVPLIVNDDVDLAMASGADGVHLGRDDADPRVARERLGPGAILGVSCYGRLSRGRELAACGADYLAFGSVFYSPTKPAAPLCGLDTLAAATSLGPPLVAIGGITAHNGAAAIRAGASFLAVISGLFDAPDVRRSAARLAALWAPGQSTEGNGPDS